MFYRPTPIVPVCGQAGPESVMEVQLVKQYEGLMDQVTFKGKLKLNVDDIYQLNYIRRCRNC